MKKIGIIGSRRRNSSEDFEALKKALDEIYEDGDVLVSGGCPKGGDAMAEKIAKDNGYSITIHYPNWEKYGKSAGFQRNGKIAEDCDILLALVAGDRKGGTEDTIRKAEKLNKSIVILQDLFDLEEFLGT